MFVLQAPSASLLEEEEGSLSPTAFAEVALVHSKKKEKEIEQKLNSVGDEKLNTS